MANYMQFVTQKIFKEFTNGANKHKITIIVSSRNTNKISITYIIFVH